MGRTFVVIFLHRKITHTRVIILPAENAEVSVAVVVVVILAASKNRRIEKI